MLCSICVFLTKRRAKLFDSEDPRERSFAFCGCWKNTSCEENLERGTVGKIFPMLNIHPVFIPLEFLSNFYNGLKQKKKSEECRNLKLSRCIWSHIMDLSRDP